MNNTLQDIDDAEMLNDSIIESNTSESHFDESKDHEDAEKENAHDTEEILDGAGDEEPTVKLTNLPLARVRKIVKTDPEINLVNQEAIFLITKATELFIDSLSKESYKYTKQAKKKTVQKKDVQSAIDNVDALMFLEGNF